MEHDCNDPTWFELLNGPIQWLLIIVGWVVVAFLQRHWYRLRLKHDRVARALETVDVLEDTASEYWSRGRYASDRQGQELKIGGLINRIHQQASTLALQDIGWLARKKHGKPQPEHKKANRLLESAAANDAACTVEGYGQRPDTDRPASYGGIDEVQAITGAATELRNALDDLL